MRKQKGEAAKGEGAIGEAVARIEEAAAVIDRGTDELRAARALGMETVPAVFVDLDAKGEAELSLRFGRCVGQWDWEALSAMDSGLLADVGFTEVELARNGAGGMGVEIETAAGDKAMTLMLRFRTEAEWLKATAAFRGKDQEARTRALVAAWRGVGRGKGRKGI